jgi:hypothetical protein
MIKIRLGLHTMTPAQKSKKLRTIADSIDGKAVYASFDHTCTALRALADDLDSKDAARDAAEKARQKATQALYVSEETVDDALRAQASSAEKEARKLGDGVEAFLVGAGFDTHDSGKRAPAAPLAAPTSVTVVAGDVPGTLRCSWQGGGAQSFNWEAQEVGSSAPPIRNSARKSRVTIGGLKSGVEYAVRVAGVGDEQGPWSDVVVRRAP